MTKEKKCKDVWMACQKVCKQGIGMMLEGKGQHTGKASSILVELA